MKYWLVLSLSLSLSFASASLAGCHAPRTAEVREEKIVLRITGMTCAVLCPPKVQAALQSVEGVRSATVDYDTKTATVVCASTCTPETLVAALQRQGFGGRPL